MLKFTVQQMLQCLISQWINLLAEIRRFLIDSKTSIHFILKFVYYNVTARRVKIKNPIIVKKVLIT